MSATLTQVQADLATEDASLSALATANASLVAANNAQAALIATLQAQLAALQAGGGASASDLAGLDTTIQTETTKINALTAAANAALTPPAQGSTQPSAGS